MKELISRIRGDKLVSVACVLAALAFLVVFYGLAAKNTPESTALSALDFKAGRIIDDEVFYNPNTMTVAEIQAHLDKYSANCDMWGTQPIGSGRSINGVAVNPNISRREYAAQMRAAGRSDYHDAPYVCISKYYENPTTHKTNFDTNAVAEAGMISAAQIIYNAAHQYNINPQVLLVMLKKESYVWGDTWPLKNEYNTVMGYACPDNAPCDAQYFGFYNQVMKAAWQLNYYKEHIYSYGYYPYMTNNIYYSPTYSCGTKAVYLENIATTSLYIYTPYTPNDAALAAYPGEAYCGSYGNRNFFMFFSEWFGSTYVDRITTVSKLTTANIENNLYQITSYSNNATSLQAVTDSADNGVKISALNKKNDTIDTFRVSKNSDGTYVLINEKTGKVLDVPNAEARDGQYLQQWNPNGTKAQNWYILNSKTAGTYVFASAINKNLVLTVKNTGLVLGYYDETTSQEFTISARPQLVLDGQYTISSVIDERFVLDVSGGELETKGTNVQVWDNNKTDAQKWNITYDKATGYYSLKTVTNMALDVSNADVASGANVQIWTSNGTCAQLWKINRNSDGTYTFFNACSGIALDVWNGEAWNGSNVQIWRSNSSKAQKWNLIPLNITGGDNSSDSVTPPNDTPNNDNSFGNAVPPKNTVANGVYTIKSVGNENYVIDVAGGEVEDGTNVQIYVSNNTSSQKWHVTYYENGDYYMLKTDLGNKYLSVYDSNTTAGTNVRIWNDAGYCGQKWHINKNTDDTYSLVSACSDKVLDVDLANYTNGTNIQIWNLNGTNAQKWHFVPVK